MIGNPNSSKRIELSVIVPVFNRPHAIGRLLHSLIKQTYKEFEVIIVEDGSSNKCENVVNEFRPQLAVTYLVNTESVGPGLARNIGCTYASGNFFVFVDSDCFLPPHYFRTIVDEYQKCDFDVFGGPDTGDQSFSTLQKAIDFSMTSFLTTGGIRAGREHLDLFYPKGFNMGIKRSVMNRLGGFIDMRYGEDTELGYRVRSSKYLVKFISDAYVHHERRNSLSGFCRQIFHSGKARVIIFRKHRKAIKMLHLAPATFLIALALSSALAFQSLLFLLPFIIYLAMVGIQASVKLKNPVSGILAAITSLLQVLSYGAGFISQAILYFTEKR